MCHFSTCTLCNVRFLSIYFYHLRVAFSLFPDPPCRPLGGRARAEAVRRRETAGGHRPRHPQGLSDPHLRRGHLFAGLHHRGGEYRTLYLCVWGGGGGSIEHRVMCVYVGGVWTRALRRLWHEHTYCVHERPCVGRVVRTFGIVEYSKSDNRPGSYSLGALFLVGGRV